MKRLVSILISGILATSLITPIFAADVKPTMLISTQSSLGLTKSITDKDVTQKEGALSITGVIPNLTSSNTVLNEKINAAIQTAYMAKVDAASKNSSKELDFSYKVFTGGNKVDSIVIYGTEINASGKDTAATINFSDVTGEFVKLNDILGEHAIEITNKVIMSEISKTPDSYDPAFKGIIDGQNFYVDGDNVVILFDAYQIAAGSMGMPKFNVPINDSNSPETKETKDVTGAQNLIAPAPSDSKNLIATKIAGINDKAVGTLQDFSVNVNGVIPLVTTFTDTTKNDKINDAINTFYKYKLASAKKDSAKSLDFTYSCTQNDKVTSILIQTTETNASGVNDIFAINYYTETGDILKINDVLGANGVAVVNKIISNQIKENKSKYDPSFKGINNDQTFYFSGNDKIIIAFGEYFIAAGSEGIINFTVNTSDLTNIVLTPDKYKTIGDAKLISLRAFSEQFGYSVTWDQSSKSVFLKKGDFTTSIKIGVNKYSNAVVKDKALESAPTLINGSTYVPVSFFESILGENYNFDNNGTLTLTDYKG